MSYNVQVAPTAEEIIRSWGLPPALQERMLQKLLNDLETKGTAALRRAVAPVPHWGISFVLNDESDPRRQHFFIFQVQISQDESTLVVVNGGYSHHTTGASPFGPEALN